MKKLFLFASFGLFFFSAVSASAKQLCSYVLVRQCNLCGSLNKIDSGRQKVCSDLVKLWIREFYQLNSIELK